jgi:hypothetical protein
MIRLHGRFAPQLSARRAPPGDRRRPHRGARRSRLWAALVLALATWAHSAPSQALDWSLSLDARLVTSDAQPPFAQNGTGTVRYGEDDSGLRLGRVRLALAQPFGDVWSAHLDVSMYDDYDRSPVGVTEAYLLFRPYPRGGYRLRLKAGGFYAPISLENRAAGWDSPYTISYSAIDSWLGIEVRTLGLEAELDWLGTRLGHNFDLGVTGGVFGWNQGAGTVLAGGGWSLTDRQTALFGRIGTPGVPPLYGALPFEQYDHRAGLYGGVEARYLDRLVVRALRYDNRADPAASDSVSGGMAWWTRFNSAGARYEGGAGWAAIVQWMDGETTIAPPGLWLNWPFKAEYALLAKRFGRHTLSARYDRFMVSTNIAEGDGAQNGHAWTAAYAYDAGAHWRIALEWLQIVSSSYNRGELVGLPIATETQVQLSIRYGIGSTNR